MDNMLFSNFDFASFSGRYRLQNPRALRMRMRRRLRLTASDEANVGVAVCGLFTGHQIRSSSDLELE